MKRMRISIAGLIMLGLATAGAQVSFAQAGPARAERVVFYDDKYDVIFAQQLDEVLRYFTLQGFKLLDTPALVEWLKQKSAPGQGLGTTVIQISDVTPNEIVAPWDKTSLLYRYCFEGGRYVAMSGNPLYAFEGANDIAIARQGSGTGYLSTVFGIKYIYDIGGVGHKLMDAGRQWGLTEGTWLRLLLEGQNPPDMTTILVQSADDKEAQLWLKTVNPQYPTSGFVSATTMFCAEQSLLDTAYKVCVYNGQPVTEVPQVAWRNSTETPPFALRLSLKCGVIERRAFQRGEKLPLRVEISGTAYRGEAVNLRLLDGRTAVWQLRLPAGQRTGLAISRDIPTGDLRCGEYALECTVPGQPPARETLWICPARRANPFPWFIYADHRLNPYRDLLLMKYLREQGLNLCMPGVHELIRAETSPQMATVLGHHLDAALRENLQVMGRPDALSLYADPARPEEQLILADGRGLTYGPQKAISWRGFRDFRLAAYRADLQRMARVLRETGSPALVPLFSTNDDGSMPGEYDFNPATVADFTKQTGLTREALPPLEHMDWGPYANKNVWMPIVAPGVLPDNHPWLRYLRYHTGNYAAIVQAAMEGLQTGWPGCQVGDLGCMSGPVNINRGYYPPLALAPYNMAAFYSYPAWFHQHSFNCAAARLGHRDQPLAAVASAAYIAWGRVYQRGCIYHLLAEAPQALSFWALDVARPEVRDLEAECHAATRAAGLRVAPLSEFLRQARPAPRRGALLFSLTQLAFNAHDHYCGNEYLRAALDNFARAGAKLDLISTEELLAGGAAAYDVIFLNGSKWIAQGEKAALEQYASRGGVVVVDAETTVPIEGALHADGPFATKDADVGKPANLARCRQYVEKYLPPDLVTTTTSETLLSPLEVGDTPLVWVVDTVSEEEVQGLSAAQGADWERGVPRYLAQREAAEPTVRKTLRVREGYYAYDLWAHREVALAKGSDGWSTGSVETEFCGGVPLALYRDRLGGLTAAGGDSQVAAGRTARLFFRLLSDRKAPLRGLVPVAVTVTRPDKTEAWEYGGNALCADGLLTVTVPLARNEAVGKWQVEVRELCSGRTAKVPLVVAAG